MSNVSTQIILGLVFSAFLVVCGGFILRRLAPPSRIQELNPDAMAYAERQFERFERFSGVATLLFLGALAYALSIGLSIVNDQLLFPAQNATYDGRRWEWWCGAGLTLALSMSFSIHWRILQWRFGGRFPLFVKYVATREKTDPRKANRIWSVLLIFITIAFCWAAWNNGIIVDERGIRVRMGWYSTEYAYDDIVSIEVFHRNDGSADEEPFDAVRIRFRADSPVRIYDGSLCSYSAGASAIADYISERASIPVNAPVHSLPLRESG